MKGQVEKDTIESAYYIGFKLHKGFIIPHHKDLKPISSSYPWGLQFEASRMVNSYESWSNCDCYSRIGLSFIYFDYMNPDVLGHSYNLVFFGEPYISFKKKLKISLRGGIGITYLDQVYDEITNPENVFYSFPLSFLLALDIIINYQLSDKINLNTALNYNHISNAGASIPNKGINFPTFSLGADYIINPFNMDPKLKSNLLRSHGVIKYARLFGSLRVVPEDGEYKKSNNLMTGIAAGLYGPITNINAWSAGFEFSYDGSFNELNKRSGYEYAPFVLSLLAGHAFVFGNISITQQMAWYTWRPFPANDHTFFQRYGLFYQIGEIFNIGGTLKAHGHVAEHMDVRFGVLF
ncbi:acyloxyacyl hydrolase [Bacteroidota bacterium]